MVGVIRRMSFAREFCRLLSAAKLDCHFFGNESLMCQYCHQNLSGTTHRIATMGVN
jgi:hypothetical protein